MGKKKKATKKASAPVINELNSDTPPEVEAPAKAKGEYTGLEMAALNYVNGVKGGRQLLRQAAETFAAEEAVK